MIKIPLTLQYFQAILANMNKELLEKLQKLAEQESWYDQFNSDTIVDDFAGGNVDDAYYGGQRDGQIELARDILMALQQASNNKCTVPPDGWECTREKDHDGPCAAIKK